MSGEKNERSASGEDDRKPEASPADGDAGRKDAGAAGARADEDATVRMQVGAGEADAGETTVRMPALEPDPEATFRGPPPTDDPEATFRGPPPLDDPDATVSGPVPVPPSGPDPDSTVIQPAPRREPDPDATVVGGGLGPDPDDTDTSFRPADFGFGPPGKYNPFAPMPATEAVHASLAGLGGLNRLAALAAPLLGAATHMRGLLRHPDPEALQETLAERISQFEAALASEDVDGETADAACHALCALIDDSVSATPWGAGWAQNGLLHRIYGTADHDRIFATIDERLAAPDLHRELLEFLGLCLALGYEGRTRGRDGGADELAALRARLHAAVRRPRADRALSPPWRGTPPVRAPQGGTGPLWATAAAALLVLGIVAARELMPSPLFTPVAGVPVPSAPSAPPVAPVAATPATAATPAAPAVTTPATPAATTPASSGSPASPPAAAPTPPSPAPAPAPAAVAAAPSTQVPAAAPAAPAASKPSPQPAPASETLRGRLAAELERGTIALTESDGRATIALRSDAQFASGDVQPVAALRPVLERLAGALDPIEGRILIVGHADSTPLRSATHASNLLLSKARAEAARAVMAAKLRAPARLRAEGRGAVEPLDPADTPEARARNRRVEIIVEMKP